MSFEIKPLGTLLSVPGPNGVAWAFNPEPGANNQASGDGALPASTVVVSALDASQVIGAVVELLEKIDLKAEAGLCQMTHGGTREFLKDIRALIKGEDV